VEKAAKWFWRAAEQDNAVGQFCWGCMIDLNVEKKMDLKHCIGSGKLPINETPTA